jgi:DNA-binding NarL/FixJ family response regulator
MSIPASERVAHKFGGAPKEQRPVRVVIGPFDELTYRGVTAVLREDSSICVVAAGLESRELESVIVQEAPHVVILNDTTERHQLEHLQEIAPLSGRLVLAHEPSRAYRTTVRAVGTACLARALPAADLLAAVHLVAQGQPVFTSNDGRQVAPRQLDTHLLTDRELAVLDCLTEARTNAEIAYALAISIRTVEKHVARVCRKLARDRRELVGCRSRRL